MVSREDIKMVCMVQILIEQCIQLDMNREQTMSVLSQRAKIEPGFTELVWARLEDENCDFFEAYRLRLALKEQILLFNELLKKQAELMNQVQSPDSSSLPGTNGSDMTPVQQNSECYAVKTGPPMNPDNLHSTITPGLPAGFHNGGAFNNGAARLHDSVDPGFDLSIPSGRIDTIPNTLLAQGSNVRMMQRMNGGIIKSDSGFSSSPQYMFNIDGDILETTSNMGGASVACFGVEPTSQPLNESLLDVDPSSFSLLGQFPRTLSLSDLTADYSRCDILESYPRSPFISANIDNFLDSHERGEAQGHKRLDTVSEGLSYEHFGIPLSTLQQFDLEVSIVPKSNLAPSRDSLTPSTLKIPSKSYVFGNCLLMSDLCCQTVDLSVHGILGMTGLKFFILWSRSQRFVSRFFHLMAKFISKSVDQTPSISLSLPANFSSSLMVKSIPVLMTRPPFLPLVLHWKGNAHLVSLTSTNYGFLILIDRQPTTASTLSTISTIGICMINLNCRVRVAKALNELRFIVSGLRGQHLEAHGGARRRLQFPFGELCQGNRVTPFSLFKRQLIEEELNSNSSSKPLRKHLSEESLPEKLDPNVASSCQQASSSRQLGYNRSSVNRLTGSSTSISSLYSSVVSSPLSSLTTRSCQALGRYSAGFGIPIDERDIWLDSTYRKELQTAIGGGKAVSWLQVFIRGKYVGAAVEIKQLHGAGELAKLLEGFPVRDSSFLCHFCGDTRLLPCLDCSGSRKVFREED
ncbi:hypothetical protein Nepgr_030174 [Nepenthes gracilis]|uniref:Uncharacterized protein n=1 Tax=Nepenthes gracilis TaxID=150966 RepID=A0AAD3TFQ6_NEPGR|nr:hypothetical protein Nepgr_030174 [Nepenthes gracilis]